MEPLIKNQKNKKMSDDNGWMSWALGVFFGGMFVYIGWVDDPAIKTKHPITPTRIEVTINPETMASDTTYIYIEEE